MRRFLLCLASLVSASSCVMPRANTPAATGPIRLTVIGTNDLHGWVLPRVERVGARELTVGGLAAFSGYLEILRRENPNGTVLLDAGDLFQGTLISNVSEGAVVVDAYNLLRYDAAAVGNHEFDYGPVGPVSAATLPTMDAVGAFKARIAQAKFPFLGANIYERATGYHPKWLGSDGTLLLRRAGVSIGVIGLSTPNTPAVTLPMNVAALRFAPLATETITAAQRLRSQGAEVILVVMHAGARCGSASDPNDVRTCDTDSAELFGFLKNLPAGTIDAAIAGHTHGLVGHFIEGVPVIESGAMGLAFGVIELFIDPVSRRVLPSLTQLHAGVELCETIDELTRSCDPRKVGATGATVAATFHGYELKPQPALVALLERAQGEVKTKQARPLGVDVPEPLKRSYDAEGALGDVLADSLLRLTHADVAILNPGGLRADLDAGPLTYGAVYEVMPFDNAIATLKLTGLELERLFRGLFASRRNMPQMAGVSVTVARCGPHRLREFRVAGQPVDAARTYTVAMSDFLAHGGEGLEETMASFDPSKIDFGTRNLREALVSEFERARAPLVAPPRGRVTLLDEGCSP